MRISDWSSDVCSSDLLIVMAGRIQDRVDLARCYGADPAFNDTALYAWLYARFGNQCDRHIRGDYAVIQWNSRKAQVRLVRSATSFCPLHYWREGNRLVVSSIPRALFAAGLDVQRSEEHTSELQSLMRISYAVFCLKKKKTHQKLYKHNEEQ